jgi:uncharacterized protein (TIGR03492 family)
MDGLTPKGFDWERLPVAPQAQVALILPGSRTPEAYANFQLLLSAFSQLEPALVGLAALTGSLDTPELVDTLSDWHYQRLAPDLARLQRGERRVYLVWGAFADCLNRADLVLAMTGTATEQAVGLGKPVISLVGGGPQFTYRFAEAQTRLLGPSVTLLPNPEAIAPVARKLLTDLPLRAELAANGLARMGTPGAAQRIAQHLMATDGTV